jgi:Zn-dependent M28 family amino/carboxypeptidase
MTKRRLSIGMIIGFILLLILVFWFATQPLVTPVASQPPAVDEKRLMQHVQWLSQKDYPRSFDFPQKLDAAASYIHSEFAATGAAVTDQIVTVDEGKTRNIIARFGPPEGALLVVGAHYDSYGDATEGANYPAGFSLKTHTPGADDNASGVAGLLELARLLANNPPKRPVELVAYSYEEPPYFRTGNMGSAWHARSLRSKAQPVQLMISLEMIGFFSEKADSQSYPVPGMSILYPAKGNYITVVGRIQDSFEARRVKALMAGATNLPVRSMNGLAVIPGVDFSDHLNYWEEGIKALMITDTAFYRNDNYHQAGDTYDTLDYPRMAKVVQGVYAIIQGY